MDGQCEAPLQYVLREARRAGAVAPSGSVLDKKMHAHYTSVECRDTKRLQSYLETTFETFMKPSASPAAGQPHFYKLFTLSYVNGVAPFRSDPHPDSVTVAAVMAAVER